MLHAQEEKFYFFFSLTLEPSQMMDSRECIRGTVKTSRMKVRRAFRKCILKRNTGTKSLIFQEAGYPSAEYIVGEKPPDRVLHSSLWLFRCDRYVFI